MRRLFEGGYYSKYRRCGYYLFQRYRNAATIRGRLLFEVRHLFEEIQYTVPFKPGIIIFCYTLKILLTVIIMICNDSRSKVVLFLLLFVVLTFFFIEM